MPVPLIVREVTLSPQNPPHRRVLLLHGKLAGREAPVIWSHTYEQAMDYIEGRLFNYFVQVDGLAVPLFVAETADGEKYLKTRTDGDQPDSLLALPALNSKTVG